MIERAKRWICSVGFFRRLAQDAATLDFGRDFIAEWAAAGAAASSTPSPFVVLDIGCGEGRDLAAVGARLAPRPTTLWGIDNSQHHVETLGRSGFRTIQSDIERDRLPFDDASIDLVIANQILEHLKEIFWVLGELSRVLKPGGTLIVGVPNLAAFHNRFLLLFGDQPVCLRTLGPHVRGFTRKDLTAFLQSNNIFEVLDCKGSHVYPFPIAAGRWLARRRPGLASAIFLRVRRTGSPSNFLSILDGIRLETNFHRGP